LYACPLVVLTGANSKKSSRLIFYHLDLDLDIYVAMTSNRMSRYSWSSDCSDGRKDLPYCRY